MAKTTLAVLVLVCLMWGPWHVARWPGGVDLVRVAHTPHATYCDFLIHDELDSKLISIGVPWRACLPSEDI